jgi:hypothetical protein
MSGPVKFLLCLFLGHQTGKDLQGSPKQLGCIEIKLGAAWVVQIPYSGERREITAKGWWFQV